VTTRWKALGVIAAAGVLVAGCSSSGGSNSAVGGGGATSSAAADSGPVKVTLITKATGGFWDAMIAGAKKYATDNPTKVTLTTLACKTNDDTPCQIAQIQDSVTKGNKAIVVSPMGPGVIPALEKARQAGVKIVFVDNTLPGFTPDAVSATDNVKGGIEAGDYIKTQLKSGDTIGLLIAVKGVPALDARIDGVKKQLDGTGITVVEGGQQTTCDPKIGATVTQDLLTRYPNLTAIYSACDSPAIGASTVAKQKNRPLKIFGYDGDPDMSKLILAGDTVATMAQSPFKMTNLGIKAAVSALDGQAYDKAIDTGVTLVTKENAGQFKDAWQ
jgi:simple sugar transport system substrate-binding protein